MKRIMALVLALGLVATVSGSALAEDVHTGHTAAPAPAPAPAAAPAGPAVLVNGQMLISFDHRAPHIHNDHVYAAVEDFAWLTGAEYAWDAAAATLTFNGKTVTYEFTPAPHIHEGTVYAPVRVLADLVGGTVTWNNELRAVSITFAGQTPAQKLGLPAGFARISPTVPAMGEHWADPTKGAFGPIYLVHQGKIIGWEVMPTLEQLNAGSNWNNLGLINVGPVDHVDFNFVPNGHDGLPVPHYDIHAYTITPEEKQAIK